jgi:hypothetical protein
VSILIYKKSIFSRFFLSSNIFIVKPFKGVYIIMAKKKLLSEAQVRRFMGLAGMQATTVSNRINEMYGMKEEEPGADAEMDDMGDMAPAPMDMGEPADEPEGMDAMDGDVDLDPDAIMKAMDGLKSLEAVLQPLADAADGGDKDPEMDEPEMDEPEMADKEDDEAMEEMKYKKHDDEEKMETMYEEDELAEVNLELSEEEVVQEVARRVAQRIIKAKRAQKELNEALGRK